MFRRIFITLDSCRALLTGNGRIKDIREGPGGAIYPATDNRGILRLSSAD
ncbi:MAG: hypothetical protein IIC10_01645 [Proteobacteria bacterium]|nr:hypothetical protein [Pseudomonadota bacterium]